MSTGIDALVQVGAFTMIVVGLQEVWWREGLIVVGVNLVAGAYTDWVQHR